MPPVSVCACVGYTHVQFACSTAIMGERDEGLIEAFEHKQKEIFEARKGMLKCERDGCVGTFNSNGRGGNSSTNGVKRMQLKCAVCHRATGLHLYLQNSKDEMLVHDALLLQELYKKATGRGNQSTGVAEQAEVASVPVEQQEAARNTPLPETEDSAVEDEVGEYCESEWKEVSSRRKSKRGAAEVEYTPEESYAHKRSDLRTTPLRGSVIHGCGDQCKDRMHEMNVRIKAQDLELKAFHKAHNDMLALMQRQSAQIAKLESLLMKFTNSNSSCSSSPSSPHAEQVPKPKTDTTGPGVAGGDGVEGTGASSTQEPTPAEAYAKTATPTSSYASATKKFIPRKEYEALKRCVSPPKPPVKMEKLHFRFYWNQNDIKSHKDAFKLAYMMLSAVGIRSKVRDISFIGRSVLELYVESEHVRVVIESMRKWVKGADTFIPASEVRDYPLHTSKWSAVDLKAKAKSRATILCARNPVKHMQVCILAEFNEAERAEILEKAAEMRASWQDAESTANEPKGMSDQSCQ